MNIKIPGSFYVSTLASLEYRQFSLTVFTLWLQESLQSYKHHIHIEDRKKGKRVG